MSAQTPTGSRRRRGRRGCPRSAGRRGRRSRRRCRCRSSRRRRSARRSRRRRSRSRRTPLLAVDALAAWCRRSRRPSRAQFATASSHVGAGTSCPGPRRRRRRRSRRPSRRPCRRCTSGTSRRRSRGPSRWRLPSVHVAGACCDVADAARAVGRLGAGRLGVGGRRRRLVRGRAVGRRRRAVVARPVRPGGATGRGGEAEPDREAHERRAARPGEGRRGAHRRGTSEVRRNDAGLMTQCTSRGPVVKRGLSGDGDRPPSGVEGDLSRRS